jgi:hypothetical protein
MNTTYSRHLAFESKAEPYNYDHEILIDNLSTEHLIVLWRLDDDEAYVARSAARRYGDSWTIVSVESSNDMAHVDSQLAYQRARLDSGMYVSFVGKERYTVTVDDDGTRTESIEFPSGKAS